MSAEYLIPHKHTLKIVCKCNHFPEISSFLEAFSAAVDFSSSAYVMYSVTRCFRHMYRTLDCRLFSLCLWDLIL